METTRAWAMVAGLALALSAVGCDDDGDLGCSGFGDELACYGGLGGACDGDRDCPSDTECCDSDNCGGGMCSYTCDDDRDCPSDMLCEHKTCFFACRDDRDCAIGWSCEHNRTICEWEKD